MEIVYCKTCHEKKRIKSLANVKQDIKNILDEDVEDYCMSYCAVAKDKYVVSIDDELVEGDTYNELLEKLKDVNAN